MASGSGLLVVRDLLGLAVHYLPSGRLSVLDLPSLGIETGRFLDRFEVSLAVSSSCVFLVVCQVQEGARAEPAAEPAA